MNKETAEIYNELIENSADKTLEQCDEYITEYEMRSYASGYNNNITAAVNKYKSDNYTYFSLSHLPFSKEICPCDKKCGHDEYDSKINNVFSCRYSPKIHITRFIEHIGVIAC